MILSKELHRLEIRISVMGGLVQDVEFGADVPDDIQAKLITVDYDVETEEEDHNAQGDPCSVTSWATLEKGDRS